METLGERTDGSRNAAIHGFAGLQYHAIQIRSRDGSWGESWRVPLVESHDCKSNKAHRTSLDEVDPMQTRENTFKDSSMIRKKRTIPFRYLTDTRGSRQRISRCIRYGKRRSWSEGFRQDEIKPKMKMRPSRPLFSRA